MSNFNKFVFDSDDWNPDGDESKGITENAVWLELKSDTFVRALFKPNPELYDGPLNLAQIKHESAQIAEKLGIPHARTEVIEYDGQIGVLSFNVKETQYRYRDISQFANYNVPCTTNMRGGCMSTQTTAARAFLWVGCSTLLR
ncbi:hypothetical protein FACS1894188_06710 [Clostridia bacterium]|nr:hypothetical protein FACS1894188_06710 [Clostridia bacterium]